MKNILLLFILLIPAFLFAQYPATGNKQRLGYQTTGDGLIWRGVAADTVVKPRTINNAYFQLDTVNGILRRYIATRGKWQTVSGGSGALTMPFDSITFNPTTVDPDTAELKYSQDLETFVFGADGTIIEIGQKTAWYVKNQSGSTINKGTIVRAAGTLGSSGRILIEPMEIDGTVNSKYLLGITASNIANGADGYVIHFGKLRKFNTSAWADGAVLYAAAAGGLTATEPNPPDLRLPIAFVVHSHATNGVLAIRIQTGNMLDELHDVDTTGIASGGTLVWDEALSKWKAAPPDHDRDSTNEIQTLFFDGGTGDLSISDGNNVSLLGILNGYTSGTGTAGRLPYWNTTTSFADSPIAYNSTTKRTTWDSPGIIELPMGTDAQRPTATTSDFWYNTTGNGIEWYNGSRWAKGLESTFNRGTAARIPFFDANGQVTDNSGLSFNSSSGVFTASSVQNSNGNPVLGCDGTNFAMGRNFDYRIVMTGNYQQFQSPTSPGVSVTNMRLQNQSAYIGGAVSPAASAVLELGSTTKGFLPPRQTSAQRTAISSPATGLQVFQTDATEGYYSKYAAGWKRHLVEGDATWLKTELEASRDVDITGSSSTDFRLRSNTRIQFDGKMKFGADSATIIDPSINRIYTKDTIYAEYGIIQTNVNPRVGKNINTSVSEQGSIFFGDGIRRFVDGWSAGPNVAFGRGLLNNAGTGGRFVAIGDVVLDGALTGYNAVGIGIEVADFAPASGDNYFIGGVTVARYATNLDRSVIIASNSFNRSTGINLSQTVAFGATLGNTMTSRNVGGTQLGYQQLQSLVSGDQVSSYGYQAGKVIKRGTNLSFVGNYTGATDTMFSDASAIGNYAAIGQNQSVTIGAINGVNSATYDAKIGIGTTTPSTKLHVVGATKIEGLLTAIQEAYNTVTSTTSPVTLSNTISDNLINQGGTQATFTLNMPASPVDGQVLYITFNNAITTLTIDGNGNTIVGSAVTTGVAGSQRKFKFYSGIGWIKQY